MSKMNYKAAAASIFLLLLMAWTASADEVLIKVDLDNARELPGSIIDNAAVRFMGESFLLVQGDEEQFAKADVPYLLLDRIEPDASYYLVRVGRTESNLSQLENLGRILLRFGDSVLLVIDPPAEPFLISLGLALSPLPENIRLNTHSGGWMSPGLKSWTEAAAKAQIIGEVINSVSTDELRKTVLDLQENKDLDPPYTPYKSRYCLRVKNTDDPSDDACDNAAEYIFNRFESYGLEAEYDIFPHEVLTQGHYEMRNVVATLPGKGLNSDRVFLITSHYDSIASNSTNWMLNWKTMPAPGADDNGSGTTAVLEAARILSEYEFNATIKFIAFSGEELGRHGSIHYAGQAFDDGANIAGVLNLDMIAYDSDLQDIDIVTNEGSEWLVAAMLSIQREYNLKPLILNKIVNPGMEYSDHASFWHNGYNAILSIDNSDFDSPEFYPVIHTTEDTVDQLDFDMFTRMVQITVGTLASLADPISSEPHPDLAVTDADVQLSPQNPAHGESVSLTASVRNVGEADAQGVLIQVWIVEPMAETPRLVAEEMADIAVDESTQISASMSFGEWGNYKILIKANPDYRIFETNGQNNIVIRTLSVGSERLAMGKLMLYPSPLTFDAGDNVNIAYSLSKDASTWLEIYDVSGRLVYRSSTLEGKFGQNTEQWNGMTLSNEKAASGIYFCYVMATDESGGTKSVSRKFLIVR